MPDLILPGNKRYQPEQLQEDFGYDNLYKAVVEAEIATMKTLAEIGIIPESEISLLTSDVEQKLLAILTTEVDRVERTDTEEFGKKTQHDVRALVRIAQSIIAEALRPWMHLPLTSFDPLDTGRILQFVRAHDVVKRLTNKLIGHFIEQVRLYANVPQIGRTHGQHALPITVGFWLATVLSRILYNIQEANEASSKLVGKISGAVGAYNAQYGLGILARCGDKSFEERVLEKLGLKPARISTQILPPEPLAYYLHACVQLSASLGQFGRDCRHLMRTEIGEVCEPFEKGQVCSSTMPHKRNPPNFELLDGTWKKNKIEFGKVFECMLSEHQRDLVGSSLARDFPVIIVNLATQLNTLLRESNGKPFISRIAVDEEACTRNLRFQGDAILAEPIYIALQMAGYKGDAHELVNHHAMPYSRKYGVSLLEATENSLRVAAPSVFGEIWDKIPPETLEMLGKPEKYTGLAAEKAHQIADLAEAYLKTQQ